MANSKSDTQELAEWTKLDFSNNTRKNKRIGVRYVRDDITVSVLKVSALSFLDILFKPKKLAVDLVDISSKGVLIAPKKKKFRINTKVILTLTFRDSKTFVINGKIVRKAPGSRLQYGIKFNRLNNELGDHLLATQRKLVFK